jgi:hypothetical protein
MRRVSWASLTTSRVCRCRSVPWRGLSYAWGEATRWRTSEDLEEVDVGEDEFLEILPGLSLS